MHTDTVALEDRVLAVALLTWQFETHGGETQIHLTDQVTSSVGTDMIDGHRNGHATALSQLKAFVEGREQGTMKMAR